MIHLCTDGGRNHSQFTDSQIHIFSPIVTAASNNVIVAGSSVELRGAADGEGGLVVDVADHQAAQHRHAEPRERSASISSRVNCLMWSVEGGQSCELADDDACDFLQVTGQQQLRQHAVDAIDLLDNIFQEEDGAVQIREERRAHQMAQEGQVAAGECPSPACARRQHSDTILALDATGFGGKGRRRPQRDAGLPRHNHFLKLGQGVRRVGLIANGPWKVTSPVRTWMPLSMSVTSE